MMATMVVSGIPAAAIALAAPAEADVDSERADLNANTAAAYLSRNLLRGTTQAQKSQFCGQVRTPSAAIGFMTYKTIQWRRDDCATVAFLFKDQVVRHPHPQVQPCGHPALVMAGG
jgi:hypothetical protein